MLSGLVNRFVRSDRGSFAIIVALSMTALFGVAGLAADYTLLLRQRSSMQQAADSAALAAAGELLVANIDEVSVRSVVTQFVQSNLSIDVDESDFSIDSQVDRQQGVVTVKLINRWTPFLMHFLGHNVTPIVTASQARILAEPASSICLLGLNRSEPLAIHLTTGARIIAEDCAVYSNSDSAVGIQIDAGAVLVASRVCSAGGVHAWGPAAVIPQPITDCPQVEDPLKGRVPPEVGNCDYRKLAIRNTRVTLQPGVYCGGIAISKGARVHFSPGVYVMDGGALNAGDTTEVEGENVGFFLTGGAVVSLSADTVVRLTAPRTGQMAGLLIFEDPARPGRKHSITSNNARVLTGTIYLPRGELKIDSKRPVADLSAYTAIIAQSVKVKDGPVLHLNSDYSATNVPLPDGMRTGREGRVVLSR